MAKVWQRRILPPRHDGRPVDWRRKMSDHIAYALLVYTGLQIFVTMGALKSSGGSLLPYLALIVLVAAIIPACRRFERALEPADDEQAHDPALRSLYRRDRLVLWLLAIGLPFAADRPVQGARARRSAEIALQPGRG